MKNSAYSDLGGEEIAKVALFGTLRSTEEVADVA
jgi:hypothetical protein